MKNKSRILEPKNQEKWEQPNSNDQQKKSAKLIKQMIKYPCETYQTEATDNDSLIQCDLWHHNIFVGMSNVHYRKLKVGTSSLALPNMCWRNNPILH